MGIVSYLMHKLSPKKPKQNVEGSIFDFKMKSLEGKEIDFSQYKGKRMMIVNTASKCSYTYQYEDLQRLHEQHGNQITILGFPANNFLHQEPGANTDIASFCQRNYGVTFQMFEKISVKGKDQHPLYDWLESKTGRAPSWNFCKYLFDEDGNYLGFYPPMAKPHDPKILKKLGVSQP